MHWQSLLRVQSHCSEAIRPVLKLHPVADFRDVYCIIKMQGICCSHMGISEILELLYRNMSSRFLRLTTPSKDTRFTLRVLFQGLWQELLMLFLKVLCLKYVYYNWPQTSILLTTAPLNPHRQPLQEPLKGALLKSTHRFHSSSFLGLPYMILNMTTKRKYNGAYG